MNAQKYSARVNHQLKKGITKFMKIFFTTSVSRMNDDTKANCLKIINYLTEAGYSVINADILTKTPQSLKKQSHEESIEIQKELTRLKKQSDIVIAEVTNQSLGVGQEIALSLTMNLPVIALFEKGNEPHILRDEGEQQLLLSEYTEENLKNVLNDMLDYASNLQDVRFNFFISPKIVNYLDWIAKKKKIPRAVYLRNLIEHDMTNNDEYK